MQKEKQTTFLALRFEYYLIAFAIGIAVYFCLSFEPNVLSLFGLWSLTLIARVVLRRARAIRIILIIVIFMVSGGIWASLHTLSVNAPKLPKYHKSYQLTGVLEDIRKAGKMQYYKIKLVNIEGQKPNLIPHRVRVRGKPGMARPGQTIMLKAVMTGPMIPVIPGGYDPARRAYFQGVGGTGFATTEMTVLPDIDLGFWSNRRRQITRIRFSLSAYIKSRAPPATSGLQAALLTGDRSGIFEQQEDSLRDAGLAHLLAISGMHMGLLAGGAYFCLSVGFALIVPFARRYDMRKAAAVGGIGIATAYLLLSGASVSTQRAYIMAAVMFSAVILNRRAVSIRSVTLAAAITLGLHPEALLNAGFHMSFAATAALVAFYRAWADRVGRKHPRTLSGRFKEGIKGLTLTSLVADFATAGFAALHFHRFTRLGLIANLLAMPIFTFVVMPAGFIGVLLIPIGLDGIFFNIMGTGLNGVLFVSNKVSGHHLALAYIKDGGGFILALYGLGVAFLCTGPRIPRLLGCVLMLLSCLAWGLNEPPDVRVSSEGRVAYWNGEDRAALMVDRQRGDGFGRSRFMESAGAPMAILKSYEDTKRACDSVGCRFEVKGRVFSILREPDDLVSSCNDSDVIFLIDRVAGPIVKRQCRAVLIDKLDLRKNGAYAATVANNGVKLSVANPESRKARPWGGPAKRASQ